MPKGTRDDGSALTIGSLKPADVDDGVVDYTVSNRILVPFSIPPIVPRNQEVTLLQTEPVVQEAQSVPALTQFRLKAELDDALLVVPLVIDEEIGDTVLISKHPEFQKTRFDTGIAINDIEYTYPFEGSSERLRKRTINGNIIFDVQTVEPPFVANVDILFGGAVTGLAAGFTIVDLNGMGRRWIVASQLVAYIVKQVLDDVLLVQAVEEEDPNLVAVAKSFALQRTPFDGVGSLGFTYAYTSPTERTVDATEDQVIIAQYDIDVSRVYVMETVGGTGVIFNGEEVLLQDMNVDGRMWASAIVP